MRRIDFSQIAAALVRESEGVTKPQLAAMCKEIVALLAAHRSLGRWRELERAVDAAWAATYGAANVTIVSAHPLTAATRAAVVESARGADVREAVDERLIGGAVIRVDNTRIDGSITGAIMRLKNAMYTEV